MTTRPISADRYLAIMRAEGLDVAGYGNWRTHGRQEATGKTFGPVNGLVIHHTAGRNSLALCYNGMSGLPGPLCHNHLAKTGRHSILSVERANHAGTFAANAHQAVLDESPVHPRPDAAEPVDGNDHYYGLEIENLGDGDDPYPWVQYVAAVKWATAICREQGWNQDSAIGHKEGTRRKIDPKGPVVGPDGKKFDFTMSRFRSDVKAALALPAGRWQGQAAEPEEDMPTVQEIADAIEDRLLGTDGVYKAPDDASDYDPNPDSGGHWWSGRTVYDSLVTEVRRTARDVAELKEINAQITAKVDRISIGGVDLDALAERVADLLAARLAQ